MTCPAWCRYRGQRDHPTVDPSAQAPVFEHVAEFGTGPLLACAPLTVEVVSWTSNRLRLVGTQRTQHEGHDQGVSLVGLLDTANEGTLLTANDARALAHALLRAADLLDTTP